VVAAAAIGDAGLRDLAGIDGVVALEIPGPHDAGGDKFADFEFEPSRPTWFGRAELASFARRYLPRCGTIRRLSD
jgi:hypothetical protein